jgi:hypothetical protein
LITNHRRYFSFLKETWVQTVAELEENVGDGRNCAKKNYGAKHM